MTDGATSWISSVSSGIDTAVAQLTTAAKLDTTVAAGIKAQMNLQVAQLTAGEGQVEVIMTMLSGPGNVGIQVAQQHPFSRG